jgi:hemolysin activation/secretion protein
MNTQIFKATAIIALTSNFLIAGSCSGGVCGAAITPHIPSDIQESANLKPFNFSGKKQIEDGYKGWVLIDNAGDTDLGENRLMSGIDVNSLFEDGDKLSLFGLVSSENLNGDNLFSGKFSYAYPLPWKDLIVEASYIQTNYSLTELLPGSTGIGTNRSVEGKLIYPFVSSDRESLKFSLYLTNNNIDEEITNDFFVTDGGKRSYSAAAHIDFETKKYPIFNLDTNHKLSLGLKTGDLSFNNIYDEKLDKLSFNTQGSYTKINIDYKNTISVSNNTSLESNFRGQYALNNKNLDDSESFTVGGPSGVKVYETGSTYDSNGFFASIEGKYKLPEFNTVKNSIGIFYDYGQIWTSDPIILTDETIAVQDAGVGIYTSYKKFFSKVQAAFEIGDSEISTKDDKNYRVLFQTGIVF